MLESKLFYSIQTKKPAQYETGFPNYYGEI
jgi:hypothetical protein